MMSSRGMGAINPKKMPGKKVIHRTDNPDSVDVYKKGGKVKRLNEGGESGKDSESDLVKKSRESLQGRILSTEFTPDETKRMPIMDVSQVKDNLMVNPRYVNLDKDSQSIGTRVTGIKKIGKDSMLQAYLDADINRDKYQGTRGRVSGAGLNFVTNFKDGGEIWSKPRPSSLGEPKKMSDKKKSKAKAMAKAAGRPYPNLIDNIRAARSK